MMNYHDGLAICRVHGAPNLVSTFACNAKWPEITEPLLLEPCQQPYNRDDLIVRLYGLKLSEYIDDIKAGRIQRLVLFLFLHYISPCFHVFEGQLYVIYIYMFNIL